MLWRAEIERLIAKLEEVSGRKLTAENLAAATKEVNDKRRALQRLNAARKASPVPISGKDALLAVQVAFYDDVPRFTADGQQDRRRARSPGGRGRGRGPGGRAAHPGHRHAPCPSPTGSCTT